MKITIRQKETLATIRARDDVLVMHTMLWPDEIRKAEFDFLDQNVEVRPQELRMATSLVETRWPRTSIRTTFTDDYRDALEAVIAGEEFGCGDSGGAGAGGGGCGGLVDGVAAEFGEGAGGAG